MHQSIMPDWKIPFYHKVFKAQLAISASDALQDVTSSSCADDSPFVDVAHAACMGQFLEPVSDPNGSNIAFFHHLLDGFEHTELVFLVQESCQFIQQQQVRVLG